MREQRITICGAGTLGAHLAESLVRLGFCNLTAIDRDRVESRNLANQPYCRHDVGFLKARALSEGLFRAVNARLRGIPKELTAANVETLLKDADLVVDAFDNHASRRLVGESCGRRQIPCLHAGLSNDGYGEVRWNEGYAAPPDVDGATCLQPLSRSLALIVTAVATEAVVAFFDRGERRSFSITQRDLAILEIRPGTSAPFPQPTAGPAGRSG